IEIPSSISITPANDILGLKENLREKLSGYLAGLGFNEILTNSITNSKYYTAEVISRSVKMINNLSADLDILRPSMLETGLESLSYNINRRNSNLRFFEVGKTYLSEAAGTYKEEEHFVVYITGHNQHDGWREKSKPSDFFTAKGLVSSLLAICSITDVQFEPPVTEDNGVVHIIKTRNRNLGSITEVSNKHLLVFDIKQPVYFIDLHYAILLQLFEKQKIVYSEISKFPAVQRDVSIISDKSLTYGEILKGIKKLHLVRLKNMRLFDIFESDKLGAEKKSMAINFIFTDEEKTLTDKETDAMMQQIIQVFEKELNAEIRK
ncbi:MAG TPA: phenylalanine--tRNA ligase subunit beta, partial [Panacibacter sp.]|nr:phenylalanine--tRNA ligase subunit beta [Panacibacter sp.]